MPDTSPIATAPAPQRGRYGSFDLTRRGTFAFFTEESLRFADLDHNGHVNNVAFTIFFENARVRFLIEKLALPRSQPLGFVLAHLSIDYRAQLFYPGNVSAAARVVEVRNSSVVIGQAIFRDEACVAHGHAVMVTIDKQSGRGVALPPELRATAEEWLRA
ncbi:MAG: acyl-CoA thioesterase [Reyranellaceae bacterium]